MDVRTRIIPRAALAALTLTVAFAAAPAPARAQTPTPVEVERVRPHREKHPTLRFLKANRDFIRARFDRLRERPLSVREDARDVDPRLLAYGELLARVQADADSARGSDEARARRELLASVTQLGGLEAQLDQLERLLGAQRERLAALERDFVGDQRTALLVVVSGQPSGATPDSVTLALEDGTRIAVPLRETQREALARGGVVEVFHGLVEPREQVFELGLAGGGWETGGPGFVSLDPTRDRLTVLRVDLTPASTGAGASSVRATSWQLDGPPVAVGG
jgi:hypothetical protein